VKDPTWARIMKCLETPDMVREEKPDPAKKRRLTKHSPSLQPITHRLRAIEVAYVLHSHHVSSLRKAQQLITDLWELHCDAEADIRAESIKLFEQAGLKVYK
jgi:hypothetical protein